MLEKDVERYLKRLADQNGMICWKFESPGTRGVPDRIIIYKGVIAFVELKRPDAKARPDEKLQRYRSKQLKDAGVPVFLVSNKQEAENMIEFILETEEQGEVYL